MEFMSADHIATMNALLRDAPTVRAACARLGQPRVLSYYLTDGPGGEPVHWTVTFGETVQFSLAEASTSDVRFVGDWTRMIQAARASQNGDKADSGVSLEGDHSVFAEINAVLETARAVATVDVDYPPV